MPREEHFFEFLERESGIAHEAAQVLHRFALGAIEVQEVQRSVQELEHRGDAILHEIEDALARTFVTPIDREDIHKLATEIDDILDLVNLTARSCAMYGLNRPTDPMGRLTELIVESTRIIDATMPSLRKRNYGAFVEAKRQVSKLEKQGDTIFRDAVSALFRDDGLDPKALLRDKEILEHLESALDRCEDVAEFLTNLAVKNG